MTVARILGARHATQGLVEVATWPKCRRAGSLVDAAHSLTAAGLGARAARWRRVGLADSVVAAAFAFAGRTTFRQPAGGSSNPIDVSATPYSKEGTEMSETVADFVLSRLRDWGVKQVFGYPGDGINGMLAAWGRAGNEPKFVQARHEEMAAFEAVGYAKFSGDVGVCAATSGPGAVHLLNGLYDAKLDHVPVVAIVGQTARSAMGGSYQQEIDLYHCSRTAVITLWRWGRCPSSSRT